MKEKKVTKKVTKTVAKKKPVKKTVKSTKSSLKEVERLLAEKDHAERCLQLLYKTAMMPFIAIKNSRNFPADIVSAWTVAMFEAQKVIRPEGALYKYDQIWEHETLKRGFEAIEALAKKKTTEKAVPVDPGISVPARG